MSRCARVAARRSTTAPLSHAARNAVAAAANARRKKTPSRGPGPRPRTARAGGAATRRARGGGRERHGPHLRQQREHEAGEARGVPPLVPAVAFAEAEPGEEARRKKNVDSEVPARGHPGHRLGAQGWMAKRSAATSDGRVRVRGTPGRDRKDAARERRRDRVRRMEDHVRQMVAARRPYPTRDGRART